VGYPAAFPEAISVGAVDFTTNGVKSAPFTFQNREVDMCAVGVDVVSTFPGAKYCQMKGTNPLLSLIVCGLTVPRLGTSMAAPAVAGFAALLEQKHKKATGINMAFPIEYNFKMRYASLKTSTIQVLHCDDDTCGAGFVTCFPKIPIFDERWSMRCGGAPRFRTD